MAALETRAWISLVLGIVWTALLVAIFVTRGGVEAFTNDATIRIPLSLVFVAMLILNLFLGVPWKARAAPNAEVDERDIEILRGAPYVQLLAIMFTLAGWVIGLTEYYSDAGCIPVTWPYLILISVVIVSTLAQALGVLLGYRKS